MATTPVCLPGEFLRQESLIDYSPWDCKSWIVNTFTFQFHMDIIIYTNSSCSSSSKKTEQPNQKNGQKT